ncbi:unnamed protein product [Peniophora sp. CBMAI 1063]|nr:unnamed protein product [Peniophora sp. CBMAI 1063]
MSLNGKVAVVTGSSRSIGAAIAKQLAADGASVIVNYVSDAAAAEGVVSDIKASGSGAAAAVKADVSSLGGAKTLLDESLRIFGKIDILVLNAGIMGSRVLAQVDEEFYDQHMNINVRGPLFLTQLAAPLLPEGSGRIIFFSTSLAHASAVMPINLVYVATKGAVEQLARVLAKDLGKLYFQPICYPTTHTVTGSKGITVNTVSPGPTDTALFRAGKTEQQIQFIAGLAPSKRLGQPDDVSPVVSFLASDGARWVNGQNILVNGGFVV